MQLYVKPRYKTRGNSVTCNENKTFEVISYKLKQDFQFKRFYLHFVFLELWLHRYKKVCSFYMHSSDITLKTWQWKKRAMKKKKSWKWHGIPKMYSRRNARNLAEIPISLTDCLLGTKTEETEIINLYQRFVHCWQ